MTHPAGLKLLLVPVIAMALTVMTSNMLVVYPVQFVLPVFDVNLADWLTWAAFSYPIAFLVTDLTNRAYGAVAARKVVLVGFALAVVLSLIFADPRIALASGSAFLAAQLMDVLVFDKLRRSDWWKAPLFSSLIGSALDTALFFSLAFAGTGLPWVSWAFGDFCAKLVMAALCLATFRAVMGRIVPAPAS